MAEFTPPPPVVYAPMRQLEEEQLKDCDALLTAAAEWLTGNADYWTREGKASPGMVSDSLMKVVDQRLDLEKQEGDNKDGEDVLAVMAQLGLGGNREEDGGTGAAGTENAGTEDA